MKIRSAVIHGYKASLLKLNKSARAFGRRVEKIEVESTKWPFQRTAHVIKKLISWVVKKTDFSSHPLDTAFKGNPVKLPDHINERFIDKLHTPERGLNFSEHGVASQFERDVFRQNIRLSIHDNQTGPREYLNFHEYYQKNFKASHISDLEKQAGLLLAEFAGHNERAVRTLSAIANQGSQADALMAVQRLAKEQLKTGEDIMFGGNTYINCDIARLSDGSFQIDQEYDFKKAYYYPEKGDEQEIEGVSLVVKVRYTVSPEGNVIAVKPEIHADWPGFKKGLIAGSSK